MKQVKRPAIDPEWAQKQLSMNRQVVNATLGPARAKPGLLDQLLLSVRDVACAQAVLDINAPEVCSMLLLAAQSAAAIFAAASASAEIDVPLGSEKARLPATGPTGISSAVHWRLGFFLAAICRDSASLNALCATPIQIIRASSTKVDECVYLSVEAYQAIWRRDPSAADKLRSAIDATDPSYLSVAPENFILNILVPELDVLFQFLSMDNAKFNESLVFALERHKKYWSTGENKRKPVGWLAVAPLALASIAYDAEMPVEVESDYLPMPLVRGDCAEAKSN